MKKIILLFLLFFIEILFVSQAEAREIKFAVLSDTNISLTKEIINDNGLTNSINSLQKAVKNLNKSKNNFVVFAGNVTAKPDKSNIVIFAKVIRKLKKPNYVIVGNQDVAQVSDISKKEFFRLVNLFSHNRIRKIPCAKRVNSDFIFVYMDGVNQFIPGYAGRYTENDLVWLDETLTKYKNKKVVIIQHFPLVTNQNTNGFDTINTDKYLELLSEHKNVYAVISGHAKADEEIIKDNVYHIGVPSLAVGGEYKEFIIDYNKDRCILKSKIKTLD